MPKMDYSKLLGRIKEYGYTQKSLAESVHISESHFCQKISGNYPFKQTDIQRICEVLHIPCSEIGAYFFVQKIEKSQLTTVG